MMLQREMAKIAAQMLHVSNCGIEHQPWKGRLSLLAEAFGSTQVLADFTNWCQTRPEAHTAKYPGSEYLKVADNRLRPTPPAPAQVTTHREAITRIGAKAYTITGRIPSESAVLSFLSDYTEAEIIAALVEYTSHRTPSQLYWSVKNFFVDGEGRGLLEAMRMGLQITQPGRSDELSPKVQEAIAWLQSALADGDVHFAKRLFKDAQDGAGISTETLRRAGKELGIEPRKAGDGWWWQLSLPAATALVIEEDAETGEIEFELPDSLLRSGSKT